YWSTHIAVGDIDGTVDGRPELVFGTGGRDTREGGQLFALHSNGRVVKGWPVLLAEAATRGPVLADLTGDDMLEIVVNAHDSEPGDGLQVWDHTGSLLWTADGSGASPVIADLDGDGDLEVLTQFGAFHHDGTDTSWTYGVVSPNGVSVGDIDGDGDMEVLIGAGGSDGLRGFHYDGSPVAGFPLFIDPWARHTSMTPVLSDLDRDGDMEVTVTGQHFAVWDMYGDYDPNKIEWSMHRHDLYRTACYNTLINLPPVWFAAPEYQVFVRHVQNEIYVQATDPEGKSVIYQIPDAPAGAHYKPDGNGLRFQWQPQVSDSGQQVTFCATDGDGEDIAKTIHIAVVNILIDLTGDGEMDLKDFQRFWGCFLGPDEPLPVPICGQADFDEDSNVDLQDFATLQIEFGALSP
ncbi:MAG: VCBS repeat-containing protein, partial [Phycisphaerales bacterium]